jgi:hypothetical protein
VQEAWRRRQERDAQWAKLVMREVGEEAREEKVLPRQGMLPGEGRELEAVVGLGDRREQVVGLAMVEVVCLVHRGRCARRRLRDER